MLNFLAGSLHFLCFCIVHHFIFQPHFLWEVYCSSYNNIVFLFHRPNTIFYLSENMDYNFFLALPLSVWGVSSLTRNWTHTVSSESEESYPLDSQGIPWIIILLMLSHTLFLFLQVLSFCVCFGPCLLYEMISWNVYWPLSFVHISENRTELLICDFVCLCRTTLLVGLIRVWSGWDFRLSIFFAEVPLKLESRCFLLKPFQRSKCYTYEGQEDGIWGFSFRIQTLPHLVLSTCPTPVLCHARRLYVNLSYKLSLLC